MTLLPTLAAGGLDFERPWALLLLPLAALGWVSWLRRRPAVRYSSIDPLLAAGRSWAVRARIVLPVLRTAALALLVTCVAGPRKGNEQSRAHSEGILIQLVVDRSGSMRAMDFELDGRPVDRLSAVKRVVRDFVKGGGGLSGRPDDLIGLIVFARYADAACPATLDHDYLLEVLRKSRPADSRAEDGTAIGDAIALGVERLRTAEQQKSLVGTGRIRSKVMIVLTDGSNNAGDIEPVKAAEIAAAFGIKVYTIGTGTRGLAPVPAVDPFSAREMMVQQRVTIDEDVLRRIAERTGGLYFRATDTSSLADIYAQIDRMEKTRTIERRYMDYRHLATSWVRLGGVQVPPLLLCALVLLAAEIVLANTRFRTLP